MTSDPLPAPDRAEEPDADEDVALVRGVAAGDHLDFLALHGRYLARCVALARRVLATEEGVADVVQAVFLDLWRQAGRYDPRLGTVASWLMTTTHHRAVDHVRREQRHRVRAARATRLTPAADSPEDPATAVIRAAEQERVARALAGLGTQQRQVLVLAYYGGLSQTQIADRLGIPLGTVKGRVRDGLQRLRRQLQEV